MDPFLKWAGGKRWLIRSAQLCLPHGYRRYVEPFLGGGAVYFSLLPETATLSDINPELIELYAVMRDEPVILRQLLEEHQVRHCNEHYYEVRSLSPTEKVARAARTLYLNRTCWNGLYRVNLKGQFNVPKGTKTQVVFANEDFSAYASALSGVKLLVSDFEPTINECGDGDFLFVDPPYTARHNKNGFLKYNESIFSWDDQLRLHSALVRAVSRGACVMVTNADHESVHSLYEKEFTYHRLVRSSVLAGKASYRGITSEALFTANMPQDLPATALTYRPSSALE